MSDSNNEASQVVNLSQLLQSEAFYTFTDERGFCCRPSLPSATIRKDGWKARFTAFARNVSSTSVSLSTPINPNTFFPKEQQRIEKLFSQLRAIASLSALCSDKHTCCYKYIAEEIIKIYQEEAYATHHAARLKTKLSGFKHDIANTADADERCYKYANEIIQNRKFKSFELSENGVITVIGLSVVCGMFGFPLLIGGLKHRLKSAASNHAAVLEGFAFLLVGLLIVATAIGYALWRYQHQPPTIDKEPTPEELNNFHLSIPCWSRSA